MRFSWCCVLISAFFAHSARAQSSQDGETRIFIDHLTEYQLMSTCAEYQVSTIVRDMSDGCGDGSKTTSFACFCFYSSVHFSSVISSKVSTNCTTDPSQTSTALSIFNKYCEEGKSRLAGLLTDSATATASVSQTSTASPASAPATVTVVSTSAPATNNQNSSKDTPVTAIAVGVCVPVGIIALAALGFFLWRRKKRQAPSVELPATDPVQEAGSPEVYELKQHLRQPPVEIADTSHHAELDSTHKRGELASNPNY